jgi:hypothetical protein
MIVIYKEDLPNPDLHYEPDIEDTHDDEPKETKQKWWKRLFEVFSHH